LARFLEGNGIGGTGPGAAPTSEWLPATDDPTEQATRARFLSNLDVFFAHVVGPLGRYRPDITALRRAPTRLVIGAGVESTGQLPHRTAAALATALATPLVELPGDHRGYLGHPEPFAGALSGLLRMEVDSGDVDAAVHRDVGGPRDA